MDEYVHWKTRQVQNEDRKVSAKWPSALVDLYGCTPHNTMCVADGTIMDYYNTDVTPSDGKHLSYTTYTRLPSQFPANTVVTLYKDGEPIAGFVMQDPTRDEYFRLPPGQIPVSAPGE